MELLNISNGVLEYETVGSGEPVLLIHGSVIADSLAPLLSEPALTSQFRLIHYHRRGFMGSPRPNVPWSIQDQADDAFALIGRLTTGRVHVVGHSFGGLIALTLTAVHSQAVASLVLLEPSLRARPETLAPFEAMARAGNSAGSAAAFLGAVAGADFRETCHTGRADWFEDSVRDLDTFFDIEVPSLADWDFSPQFSERVSVPTLSVLGQNSPEVFGSYHRSLLDALFDVEAFVLSDASHGMAMQNSPDLAAAIAGFLARHPLSRYESAAV